MPTCTRTVAATLTLAFAAGCLQTQFVRTNPPPRALTPRDTAQLAVYTTIAPDRPYVEIGMVMSRAPDGSLAYPKATLLQEVREEAARQGCDGIIYAAGAANVAEATCIVFK